MTTRYREVTMVISKWLIWETSSFRLLLVQVRSPRWCIKLCKVTDRLNRMRQWSEMSTVINYEISTSHTHTHTPELGVQCDFLFLNRNRRKEKVYLRKNWGATAEKCVLHVNFAGDANRTSQVKTESFRVIRRHPRYVYDRFLNNN